MLLAVDVGGTKTLIGVFRPDGARPTPVTTREYATQEWSTLTAIVRDFVGALGTPPIEAVVAGVAGPVSGMRAELTNVEWTADLDAISRELGSCPAALLNDLEAMAYSVGVLTPGEQVVLQAGTQHDRGNRALIAAGTGLNASHIQMVDGRLVPSASESGHADFAARTQRELELVEFLTRRHGRAEVEGVLSGPGVVNLFEFTHATDLSRAACPVWTADVDSGDRQRDRAAEVTTTAMERRCRWCEEALQMFVSAYGAETGNLALRAMATGGVYVGGGIAPKILPALQDGRFIEAFRAKAPMTDLLTRVPVCVVVNRGAGLVGASVKAMELTKRSAV